MEKKFLSAEDVAAYMEISVSKAYKMIRRLNDELESKGFLIIHGKVSKAFFEQRVYGICIEK